jgi:hypothetical protein
MVTRVWGKADSFELVFYPSGDSWKAWEAKVPADLEDGQYIVELYCEDDGGNTAFWTGILYLNNSANVKVRIVADKIKVWLEADMEAKLQDDWNVWLEEERIKLNVTCMEYVGRG